MIGGGAMKVNKYRLKRKIVSAFSSILKLGTILTFAFPFYWMVITSLKTYAESIENPPTFWPREFTLEAFTAIFVHLDIWPYVRNTLVILVWGMLISTIVMVPAAYVFARYEFKGKKLMFNFVTMSFMIPGQITFITKYIMFSKMNVLGTLIPQICSFILNSFGIFMLRQSFMQVPDELVESAQLDEANELQIITKIMLPMAKSAFVTVSIMQMITIWNAYFPASVYCVTEATKPITMLVTQFRNVTDGGSMQWPTIMAGNLILVVPVMIVFLFGSKKILSSIGYRGAK